MDTKGPLLNAFSDDGETQARRRDAAVSVSGTSIQAKPHLLFLSSCPEFWGGSEELWAGAARHLCRDGFRISACKTAVDPAHSRIAELRDLGVVVEDYWATPRPGSLARLLAGLLRRAPVFLYKSVSSRVSFRRAKALGSTRSKDGEVVVRRDSAGGHGIEFWKRALLGSYQHFFLQRLRMLAPDLAVISQGENFDGLDYVAACRRWGVPYVLICQKASDMHWPADSLREPMQQAFREARRVYFVSEHNRRLTERQMGCLLSNAEVARNPYLTGVQEALPYPDTVSGEFRLACVARLFFLDKGQDTLLTVLAQEKWKRRNLRVDFYGQGIQSEALQRTGEMLGLHTVCFRGFTSDITEVWRRHHALVLPSRAEGLPLALVEAMMCGRPGIVTDVGGNAEVVEDGQTGFLARGMDAASLDEVLERAWSRRDEWEGIGLEAARSIRRLVPADPCGDFAAKLSAVLTQRGEMHPHESV